MQHTVGPCIINNIHGLIFMLLLEAKLSQICFQYLVQPAPACPGGLGRTSALSWTVSSPRFVLLHCLVSPLSRKVSSIAKDVFVVDEEEARAQDVWREREAEKSGMEKGGEGEKVNGGLGEGERLHSLERQLQVAIREKEEQCQTFRELLLEKEKEIEELSGMVEEKEADEGGEKEERMEVWTGYKMKLVEVLRAGDQLNMEEDVSYDQLLNIVEQLVRDKQVKIFKL